MPIRGYKISNVNRARLTRRGENSLVLLNFIYILFQLSKLEKCLQTSYYPKDYDSVYLLNDINLIAQMDPGFLMVERLQLKLKGFD